GPLDHSNAELGRNRDPPSAHQQLDAQLGLELADVLGHIGLHGVELIGGGRETSGLGDGQEGLQLTNVHHTSWGGSPVRAGRAPAAADTSPLPIHTIVPNSLTDGLVIGFTRTRTTGVRGNRRPPRPVPSSSVPRS